MRWEGIAVIPPHPAVLMEGTAWDCHSPRCEDGFTAMCLTTGELGFAGWAECEVLGYKDTEANRIRLAVHMLSCGCGWSHAL